jgi:hypothetical protein
MPRLSLAPLVCALACATTFPAGAIATVTHDGSGGTIVVTEPPEHNTNICGLPGTFRMVSRFEWHSTEASGRFHFQLTEVSRWTVTFDDPAVGVWSGRGTETNVFTASPGDVLTFHVIFNGSEGPVRIHEHQQVLVAADGTLRVDIDQVTTDYGACPS